MTIQFLLNGKKVNVTSSVSPSLMLVEYIRNHAGLTGTKIGCGEGGCGACVVRMSYKQGEEVVNKSVNSCLVPLCQVDGTSITTIEGIGGEKSGKFHPVQESLSDHHASQCGFCTPGMSMSIYSYLKDNKVRTPEAAEHALDGNLCRCTGYRPIFDTLHSFCNPDVDIEELGKATCPLQQKKSYHTEQFHRVTSLAEFADLQKSAKDLKIIAGATSRGIYKDEFEGQALVDISAIHELHKIEHSEKGVRLGGAATCNKLIEVLEEMSKVYPKQQSYFSAFITHINKIAGTPVRNDATIGGNIALKVHRPDFPSDLVTILTAANATVEVVTGEVKVEVPISKVKLDRSSVIASVFIPFARHNEHFLSHKVGLRKQNAHAYVNHSFRFVLSESKDSISESSVVFGAFAPKTHQSHAVQEFLKGKKFSPELMEGALKIIDQEIVPEGEHVTYLKMLANSLFYKSLLHIFSLGNEKFDPKLLSAANPYERPQSTGDKSYGEVDDKEKPLGQPVSKLEAKIQASGEATYSDDTAVKNRRTLFGAYVVSSVAAGKIKSIDTYEAERIEGFVSWVSRKDVPGTNQMAASGIPDVFDFAFAEEEITYHGQMIGVVVAESQLVAMTAAKKVKIEYDTAGYTPITNIPDAIKAKSFHKPLGGIPEKIEKGDVEKTFTDPSLTVIEGEATFGSQYAFYMEPQVAYAEHRGNDVIVMHSSVQDPTNIQENVAKALGRHSSKVQVIAQRVGGAFGSKATQATRTSVSAAVCAAKLGADVTIALDRDTDIINIGKRHPFLCQYKVSVDPKTGKIGGVRVMFYCDSGYNYDMSPMVLFICMMAFDSCYHLENCYIGGHLLKTNTPNNTAVRTFGGIQATYFIQHIMNEVAQKLQMPVIKVMEANFYKSGQTTPMGLPITEPDFTLHKIWPEALKNSHYFEKEKEVEKYNKENRWRKRGISVVPIRYQNEYSIARHGSELSVYSDGSVIVGTSGIDMGQGLNTKVAQEVAHSLGVPLEKITVAYTDTFHVANSSMSAGSFSSHSCMAAARAACEVMHERLAPFKKTKPDASWEELCGFAVQCGAHLSVTGYFVSGKIVPNSRPQTPKDAPIPGAPTPMDYNCSGVGVSEVEVDILTGEVQVLSAYVFYDAGKSANPASDLGQVEGGFVMGIGNMLTEEIKYSQEGRQLADSTWTYKIPSSMDIPIHSSMNLFCSLPNERGMLRSKAVSEGPMCLSVSVFFAVKNALRYARVEADLVDSWFPFNPPATPQHICEHTGTTLSHLKNTAD